jgi:AAHS family benzoate transporter-like MFS transporter
MRSSGLGWALGVGRLGAITGPMIGGLLMTISLPFYQNFLVFAIPGAIAFVMIILVQEKYSATSQQKAPNSADLAFEEGIRVKN